MNEKEFTALISLLDDTDTLVFQQVRERFFSIGSQVIPLLESVWENSSDVVIQNRIEEIIHGIQFNTIIDKLSEWTLTQEQNLLDGALLIAKYQYPDLNEKKIRKQLHQIKQDIWIELNDKLTALEKARIVNHILFEVHNFSSNTQNYHSLQSSYINNVLESKRGNPLSLSILYLVIVQELNIPIFGVNLPEHFILCYKDENQVMSIKNKKDSEMISDGILFYINPFNRGVVFGKKVIDTFLIKLNLDPQPNFYQPCTNAEMIKRLMRILINSYQKLGYSNKVSEIKILLSSLDKTKV
ncbi:MAG: transglutaminase-like domain-containing protein [Bacteroidota bacterium]